MYFRYGEKFLVGFLVRNDAGFEHWEAFVRYSQSLAHAIRKVRFNCSHCAGHKQMVISFPMIQPLQRRVQKAKKKRTGVRDPDPVP